MIVTGTHITGLKAIDSPSPVQVLDVAALERTGQPDLIQALAQNLPSFTAQAFGGDTANLTLSAKVRGLSPNHTLVLINGKRRHTTANLAVLAGAHQGGAAADLSFIPVASIERIEVLQEGAAAQHGTDAIAGVVNIILKSADEGGSVAVTGGKYFDGGGPTADISANIGVKPFEKALLYLSAESKYHGWSDRGGIDPRLIDPGVLAAQPTIHNFPGYPHVNHISGDTAYHVSILSANFGLILGGATEFYSVATYGQKKGQAYVNYRTPSRLRAVYPNGVNTSEALKEEDDALTAGFKGEMAGWN